MTTYYSCFIPDLSTLTAPLRQLLKTNTRFNWTPQCGKTFKRLKEEIVSDRVLMPYNPELPLRLACDASSKGVSGILTHVVNGEERPIAFAFRSLTSAERNYSQLDREALAIIYSVDHFYQYLFDRHFQLITDNQPLTRIFHHHADIPKMTSARLQRYAAFLSGFDYEISSKKGVDNANADCSSRAPIPLSFCTEKAINKEVHLLCEESILAILTLSITFESIRNHTRSDDQLSKILEDLKTNSNFTHEFTIDNDVLFRDQRVVIPKALQSSFYKNYIELILEPQK